MTYRVYTLDTMSEDETYLNFVLAARLPTPGPRQPYYGPATGLSLREARQQVASIERMGNLAFLVSEPLKRA
jgi:hypothetical protein